MTVQQDAMSTMADVRRRLDHVRRRRLLVGCCVWLPAPAHTPHDGKVVMPMLNRSTGQAVSMMRAKSMQRTHPLPHRPGVRVKVRRRAKVKVASSSGYSYHISASHFCRTFWAPGVLVFCIQFSHIHSHTATKMISPRVATYRST